MSPHETNHDLKDIFIYIKKKKDPSLSLLSPPPHTSVTILTTVIRVHTSKIQLNPTHGWYILIKRDPLLTSLTSAFYLPPPCCGMSSEKHKAWVCFFFFFFFLQIKERQGITCKERMLLEFHVTRARWLPARTQIGRINLFLIYT